MSKEEENDDNGIIEIKAILLGETGVGKTNLANAAVDLRFDQNAKSTSNALYVQKKMIIFGKNYQLRLWDTAGQEKYRALTKLFYKDSKVVIFVYDITNKKSFTELNFWINEIKESLGDEPVLGILGNKNDLEEMKEVDDNMAQKFAEEKGIKFKVISTKDDPKSFKMFLRSLIKDYLTKKNGNIDGKNSFDLENEDKEKKHKC
jgi:small GTP-binding protein